MAANVRNCNFTDNSAFYYGGALWIYSGALTECNFINNSASNRAGAVRIVEEGNIKNCNFTNNSAKGAGAVMFGCAG